MANKEATPRGPLRRLRQRAMLSQADLARISGVSRGSIVRLEQHPKGAYYGTIIRIAEALGIEPADLRDQLEGVA